MSLNDLRLKEREKIKEETGFENHPVQSGDNNEGDDPPLELEDSCDEDETPRCIVKCSERMERFMLDPTNKRLK